MVGPETIFQNRIFESSKTLYSDWFLQVQHFIREPYLSYPESTMGLLWLGPEKNFQAQGSWKAGKRYFKDGFCKYSICFL